MSRRGTAALRFLGLAATPRPVSRPTTSHVRVRAGAQTRVDGSRRVAIDAHMLLAAGGRGDRVIGARPGAVRRRGEGRHMRPERRVSPLVALGLARASITVAGHPRMRARVLEQIRRRRVREQMLTASIGAILMIVLGTWGLLRSPLMSVEAVSVVGVTDASASQVQEAAAIPQGTNVLDVDLERVTASVTSLPWVDAVTVRRRLPSTIELRVAERRPLLAGVYGGSSYLLDAGGVVIGQVDQRPAELPTVPLSLPPAVGSTLDTPDIRDVTSVAAAMPAGLDQWIEGYESVPDGMVDVALVVPTTTGPVLMTVHLGRPVDVPAKAATVASLVTEVVASGQRPQAVDVRIPDRPVVIP